MTSYFLSVDGRNGDGDQATSAQIANVISIAIDRQRNVLYLTSVSLSRVRAVDLATGIITTFADTGLFSPYGIGYRGDGPLSCPLKKSTCPEAGLGLRSEDVLLRTSRAKAFTS